MERKYNPGQLNCTRASLQLARLFLALIGVVSVASNCHSQGDETLQTVKKFKQQLQKRVSRDQSARKALIKFRSRTRKSKSGKSDKEKYAKLVTTASETDKDNLVWVKNQLDKHGFPPISVIGQKSADQFFLLILHADRDRDFQQKCVNELKAMPAEWPESYAKVLEKRLEFTNPDLKQPKPTSKEQRSKAVEKLQEDG